MTPSDITIIIPTAGRCERRDSLSRAIKAVLSQKGVDVSVLVILNGDGYDPALREQLEARDDISFVYNEEGCYAEARHLGVTLVTSAYFGCIDDDDYFLPGALKERFDVLEADRQLGLVVSNGFYKSSSRLTKYIESFPGGDRDPCEELFRQNWLASSGGLFRRSAIAEEYFDPTVKYFEWTFTAFCIAQAGVNIRFLDRPHMVISDTGGALSKSFSYFENHPKLWERLQSQNREAKLRGPIRKKLTASHHGLAERYRDRCDGYRSWQHHLKSLRSIHGLRYIPFTRHLLRLNPLKPSAKPELQLESDKTAP